MPGTDMGPNASYSNPEAVKANLLVPSITRALREHYVDTLPFTLIISSFGVQNGENLAIAITHTPIAS